MGIAAAVLGLIAGGLVGWWSAPLADAVAAPRYGVGAPRHDPEDLALAPLGSPLPLWARNGVAAIGALFGAVLASRGAPVEVVLVIGATAAVLGVAGLVDLQYLRLPDLLTYGVAAGSAVAMALASVSLEDTGALRGALVGGLGLAGFLLVVGEVFRLVRGVEGMGLGDIKLALSLGATAGWVGYDPVIGVLGSLQVTVMVLVTSNLVGLVGGVLLTRRDAQKAFPFGPFLLLGWALVVAVAA